MRLRFGAELSLSAGFRGARPKVATVMVLEPVTAHYSRGPRPAAPRVQVLARLRRPAYG